MKRLFKQLRTSLRYNLLLNHYHFIALGLIFTLILYRHHHLFLFLLIFLFFIYLFITRKILFWFSLIICFFALLTLFINDLSNLPTDFKGIGKVVKITDKVDYQQIIVKTNKGRYIINIKKEEALFRLGDQIYLESEIEEVLPNRIPGLFNYQQYLKDKKILGLLKVNHYQYLGNTWTYYKVGAFCASFYERFFEKESASFLKALVLGQNSEIESDLRNQINKIGISHLFVVSGLHVNIIILLLEKILSFLKFQKTKQTIIIISMLFGYLIITCFLISVIRVFISEVIKRLNQRFSLGLTSTDQMSINIIIVLLINPLWAYQMSFILTYLISSTLIISSTLLKKFKPIQKSLMLCLLSMFVSLPLVIDISLEINILSLLYNLIYIPFVTFFFLPISFIVTFFPFLGFFYQLIVMMFIKLTIFFSNIDIGIISFPKISWTLLIFYYGFFWYLCKSFEQKRNFKGLLCFLLILICWHESIWFNSKDQVYFLDLIVGEATLIQQSFNKANILIDTGDNLNDDLIIFLKKKGIRRLDYLIITHSDSDHCGQALNICKQFKVENIILSSYDKGFDKMDFSFDVNPKYIHYVQNGDYFQIGNLGFEVIHPSKSYTVTNNNSIVLKATLFNQSFLFTGDIEAIAEQDLIKSHPNFSVDYLKVAHHGSITSTSEAFLKAVNFDVAIIMNGSRNNFGFPNPQIVKRLKDKILYITSINRTIVLSKPFFRTNLSNKKMNYQ